MSKERYLFSKADISYVWLSTRNLAFHVKVGGENIMVFTVICDTEVEALEKYERYFVSDYPFIQFETTDEHNIFKVEYRRSITFKEFIER